jgi:predicted amidohydrolase
MRAAAIQMEAQVADVEANLEAAERLADRAAAEGAECIVLPEFFTTGIGFVPELADCALTPDGEATELLLSLAGRHGAMVGGSFLCRDADGEVRNAFILATADGEIAGRHDKDLPTMWENAFYVGGDDDGVIDTDDLTIGAAVCWELMRTQTVRRLAGRIDLALTGSDWWSMSENWPPRAVFRRIEAANHRRAVNAAASFAQYLGAPVVHAAHAGRLVCEMPWLPLSYRGHSEGGTLITDAEGRVLDAIDRTDGEGFAIADVEPGRREPLRQAPDRFWLHDRGAVAAFAWNYQRLHGRRWYRKHVRGRQPSFSPSSRRREPARYSDSPAASRASARLM